MCVCVCVYVHVYVCVSVGTCIQHYHTLLQAKCQHQCTKQGRWGRGYDDLSLSEVFIHCKGQDPPWTTCVCTERKKKEIIQLPRVCGKEGELSVSDAFLSH